MRKSGFVIFALMALLLPVQAVAKWTMPFNRKDLDDFRIAHASVPVDGRPVSESLEADYAEVYCYNKRKCPVRETNPR